MVNFTAVVNDAQVARTTIHEYFRILQDTLVLCELPAWKQSKTRRPIVASEYYFFDIGVVNTIQGRTPKPGTPEYGAALETLVMHERASYVDYISGEPLHYSRSASRFRGRLSARRSHRDPDQGQIDNLDSRSALASRVG
jgi:predicted AAA+ superfamily ATPase